MRGRVRGPVSRFLAVLLLGTLLSTPPAEAYFRAGVEAVERGDYAAALAAWLPLAEAGDGEAQLNVGLLYEQGLGVARHTAAVLDVEAEYEYERRYPATINHAAETATATRAAIRAVGEANVILDVAPMPGGEDFSFMLEKVPGSYVLIGNGTATAKSFVHAPLYDFNDDIIDAGVSFWVHLVGVELGEGRP